MKKILLATSFALGGCVSVTDPVSIGKDSYVISASDGDVVP